MKKQSTWRQWFGKSAASAPSISSIRDRHGPLSAGPPVPGSEPTSFGREIERSIERFRDETGSRRTEFIRACNDKLQAYRLIDFLGRELGVPLRPPEVHVQSVPIEELDLNRVPETFVLKPTTGAANRGVYCIERRGDKLVEVFRQQEYTARGLKQAFLEERESLKGRSRYSTRVIVEEWVRDDVCGPIPLDYRMYSFWGRIGMIQQRDCNGGKDPETRRFRYYDDSWNDLGKARNGQVQAKDLAPPPLAEEAVRVASVVSQFVPLPFIRVDMYITPRGLRFGEFTPHPGSHKKYRKVIDERLGAFWDDARLRLESSRLPERDEIQSILKGRGPDPNAAERLAPLLEPWRPSS